MKQNNLKYDTISDENTNHETNEKENNLPEIDKILDKQGYGIHTIKYILIVFLIISLEGLHMTLFSMMILPLSSFYHLSDFQIKFVSAIMFVGVGVGSISSGTITKKFDRTTIINIFLAVIFICNVIMGFTHHFGLFILVRLLIGYSLGLIVPTSLNLLAECLPIKNRAFVLTCIWCAFQIGQLYLLGTMLGYMPNFEVHQVQLVLLLSSFLALITLFTSIGYLEDSPRMLILRGNKEEGFRILEIWNNNKLDNSIKNKIISEVSNDPSDEQSKDISLLFNNKFRKLSILLILVWFSNSVMSYGTGLIMTLTLKSLGVAHNFSNRDIIVNQIIMAIISFPSNFLGGIMSELSFLGRNKSTNLGFLFTAIFMLFAICLPNYFTFFMGLSFAFMSIAFNVNTTYSCEIYPTKMRDMALGYLFFSTRVGGFLSQFFYMTMNNINIWLPYYFTIFLILISMALIYLMPYDTYGKPLDIDVGSDDELKV